MARLPSYNQLQKYLRRCTLFWPNWLAYDLVLVIALLLLSKLLAIQDQLKRGRTTLNGEERGCEDYIA